MRRFLLSLLIMISLTPGLSAQEADSTRSSWWLEFLVQSGTSKVLKIESQPQPAIGAASQAGAFALSLFHDLGSDLALSMGVSLASRQGQAWMGGQPFEVSSGTIDIPVMLYSTSFHQATPGIDVFLQYGIGPLIGLPFEQKAHEVPGIPFAGHARFEAGFLDYLLVSIIMDIRIGLRFNRDFTFMVGFRAMQDLDHFGVGDEVLLIPRYNLSGITLGISRSIF